jgi:SagB-type dehydrogenase family enzyme
MLKKVLPVLLLFLLAAPAFTKETVKLPLPKTTGKMSLEESLYNRRSQRSYTKDCSLTKEQISQLLWAAQGISDPSWGFRTAPSAGSIYPLEVYIVKADGVFHYLPNSHSLELHLKGDKRMSLVRASLGQEYIGDACADIIIAAGYDKTREKFGQRSDRYVQMEAGHAAQNVLLEAVAMGLGAIPVGSFWDDVVIATLELPYGSDPLYIIPVGYIK